MPNAHTRYRLFGLEIEADAPLGGLPLPCGEPTRPVDLEVSLLGHGPLTDTTNKELVTRWSIGSEHLYIWRTDSGTVWEYPDDTQFLVSPDARRVEVRWPSHYVVEDAVTYLLGPILGFVLRQRGARPLHGSAVEVAGRAVVFLGPAGSGKSTLAAAMHAAGHRLIAEDVTVVEETPMFVARPGLPLVKLWPESAERHGDLARLTPNWDKRYLDAGDRFADTALPLSHLFLLREGAEVALHSIAPAEALAHVLANLYVPYTIDGVARADDLEFFGLLVDEVNVSILERSSSLDDLPMLVEIVKEHA